MLEVCLVEKTKIKPHYERNYGLPKAPEGYVYCLLNKKQRQIFGVWPVDFITNGAHTTHPYDCNCGKCISQGGE